MTALWPNWKSLAKTLPNDAGVFELKGYIQRRQGKQEEAVRSLERAIDLDPRNSFHAAADCAQLSSSAAVSPKKNRFWTARWLSSRTMSIQTRARGRGISIGKLIPARCIKWSIQFGPQIPPPLRDIAEYWLICALAERDAAAAKNAVIAAGENPAFNRRGCYFQSAVHGRCYRPHDER